MLQVGPEHLPRRHQASVAVKLLPSRPAHLQPRPHLVHQPLGVAQLVRAHAVERLVQEALTLAP